MALEDLQSQYGPTNKKGEKGTGSTVDTFAFEGKKNLGVEGVKSKYATSEKNGTKPTGTDVFGNIPAERSFE
jgi:hypothetical protein|tara:strand:- start:302 stop:517 length:216 start_codon:yes stop_codon:yes gene_type:complete